MPFHRGRRRRTRSTSRGITRTYKKVLNFAPISRPASTQVEYVAVTGVDSISPGQLGVTDSTVPTGAVVEWIIWQYSEVNLLAAASFTNIAVQLTLSGQTPIDPRLVGGNAQRNQIFHQALWVAGQGQNSNHTIRFAVPKSYQRIREGMVWSLSMISSAVKSDACQIIYKLKT